MIPSHLTLRAPRTANGRLQLRRRSYFTNRTLTSHSGRCVGYRHQIHKGVSASVHDSLSRSREVDSLSHALPDLLEPSPGIGAVNHAPQKAQALGCIVAVSPNVDLCNLGIQCEEAVHAPRFGEDVSRVTELWGFDDDSFLDVEDVFVAEQIDPACPA